MVRALEPSQAIVLLLGAMACWFDLRTRHIPNWLTFGGAAVAFAYAVVVHGMTGLLISSGGWLTGVAIFLPLFLLGGMGAGDIKLLACFGAWLGPRAALWIALYAALAGGVLAITMALVTGYLSQAIYNIMRIFAHWRRAGLKPVPGLTLEGSSGPRLPYALPIVVGAVAAMWFR
jgi:prepilin peptidase CpaA